MRTDIPLKRLTRLRPADILALIGDPLAQVLGVEALELPASQARLDTVLRLQRSDSPAYLHLIEWQGYPDSRILWRTLGYLAWLGQNRKERPILATIIYLSPADDAGSMLEQAAGTPSDWRVTLQTVRLWEQDALAAVGSGAPGLLALSPLMRGATAELVEQAVQQLISAVDQPAQGELLAALGIFAEPLFTSKAFIRLVTKERLMTTDLITYLMQDKVAEFEQERLAWRQAMQQSVEDVIAARFPDAPLGLTRNIRQIGDPAQLQRTLQAVLAAPTLEDVARLLTAAAANSVG